MPMFLQGNYPQVLYANLPTASTNTNKVFLVTDIARGGSLWRSDGTSWMPVGGSVVLADSGVASSVTGITSVTTLASITIPANIMGTNGQLRITTLYSAGANNANVKKGQITFGSTIYATITLTSLLTGQCQHIIRNRGVANSQVGFVNSGTAIFTTSTAALITSAEDTTTAKTLLLQGSVNVTSDTITLESYSVELIR